MARSGPEVADVFRRYGDAYRQRHALPTTQRRVMTAIERCWTAALGGHVDQCDQCGHQRISYNSCRNRHCPKCQSLARAEWLEDRRAETLDTQYFHVVFTVPEEIGTAERLGVRPPWPALRRDRRPGTAGRSWDRICH